MEKRQHSASKTIPSDVILDILVKLPLKSVVRFRCVSKFCKSSVITPRFVKEHNTRFPVKSTGFLISCSDRLQSAQKFFYADYDGGPAVPLLTIPPRLSRYTTQSVNGLVCLDFGICATICNPSTRQAITLPLVCSVDSPSASSTYFCVNSFGFDPVTKQYKVLNSWKVPDKDPEYRVFTLGDNSWRLISGGPPYYPQRESICTGGVIYYRSWTSMSDKSRAVLVSFDVGKESFRVIHMPERIAHENESELIVFDGLPGIVCDDELNELGSLVVWTVHDRSWYRTGVMLPQLGLLQDLQEEPVEEPLFFAGTMETAEILLVPRALSKNFCVYYYEYPEEHVRRVEISGLPDYTQFSDFSSINTVTVCRYEENILSFT